MQTWLSQARSPQPKGNQCCHQWLCAPLLDRGGCGTNPIIYVPSGQKWSISFVPWPSYHPVFDCLQTLVCGRAWEQADGHGTSHVVCYVPLRQTWAFHWSCSLYVPPGQRWAWHQPHSLYVTWLTDDQWSGINFWTNASINTNVPDFFCNYWVCCDL